ncbi:MAG: SHOCT domain-containing protein [Actinomycetes bacterium]
MFGRGKHAQKDLLENGQLAEATILEVTFGRFVRNKNSGVGGSHAELSASQTLRLRVAPSAGSPYETTLKLGSNDTKVPAQVGTRFNVLVDPTDPQHVALPPDPAFTLPGGGTWTPNSGTAGTLSELANKGDASAMMAYLDTVRVDRPPASAPAESAPADPVKQLEDLARLRDSGILTEAEFSEQKARILGNLT